MKFNLTTDRHSSYDAYRIMAMEDTTIIRDGSEFQIKSGDIGGYLEKKENLDENSNAWVFDNSVVLGNSQITGTTIVQDGALLKNVTVGSSFIKGVYLSDMVFPNEVRIYGNRLSFTLGDKSLKYKSMTASRTLDSDTICIGYAKFIGSLNEFRTYVQNGLLCEVDTELCKKYIPLIERSLLMIGAA